MTRTLPVPVTVAPPRPRGMIADLKGLGLATPDLDDFKDVASQKVLVFWSKFKEEGTRRF